MRTETDEFKCSVDSAGMDTLKAVMDENELVVKIYNYDWSGETVFLTKQQAAEFARQLLEICGEQQQ